MKIIHWELDSSCIKPLLLHSFVKALCLSKTIMMLISLLFKFPTNNEQEELSRKRILM